MKQLLFILLFCTSSLIQAAIPILDFKVEKRCLGDSTLFTDLSCCNIDQWVWDFGDPLSGSANYAYTRITQHKYSNTGTYTVTLRLGSGALTDSIIKQVVICVPVKPLLSFHDTTICRGNGVFLYSLNTFNTYYWNTNDTVRGISITNSGTYVLCATNCDSTCLVCDTAKVTVLNTPTPFLSKYSSSCLADSFELNARNSGFRYLWSTNDTTQKIWIKKSGWYIVKIYNSKCFILDSTYFSFAKKLVIDFKTDTVACLGDTILLNPGWQYPLVWWNYTDTNHVLKVYASGIYPLRIYYLGCYIDTFASVVFASTSAIKLPDDTTLCEGDTLFITPAITATKYYWSNGDTTKSTKIYSSGVFWLSASFNGCFQSDTIKVKVIAKPLAASVAKVFVCEGAPATISVPVAIGNNFQWWDGNTLKSRTFLDTGWHHYEIRNACFLLKDSAYTGYYIDSRKDSIARLEICFEDDSVLFLTARSSSSYRWEPENTTTQTTPIKKYGWHRVLLTDSGGCKDIDSFYIQRKCSDDTLLIPNAFSPNHDGKNEVFKPSFVRHVNYELRIYDRWGEELYKTNSIMEGWDGQYHGAPAPEDVYIYIVEVSGFGVFRELKGTFHLLR